MSDQKNGGDHEDDLDELSASDESEPEGGLSSAPFDPELDDDDDDDEDGGEVVLSAPPAGRLVQSPFSLRGGGSAFSNRSHSIFECLDSVARLASSSSASSSSQNHRPVSDGVFARPLPPPPSRKTSQPAPSSPTPAKKRGVPDYLVHPERWTRYSLEDVTETSEQGNTRAAHNFLSSLQQSKEPQESAGDSNLQHKMIFSRPSGLKEQPADPPTAATGRDKEARLRLLEEEEEEEEECRKKDTRLSHLEEEDDVEEKEMAEARRTEQRGGNAEEKDTRAAVGGAEEKKKVQKGVQEGEDVPSFRKTKRKNYRTSAGQEDN